MCSRKRKAAPAASKKAKTQKIIDSDNTSESEETTPDRTNKKGLIATPGGRPSVKKLAVNAKYGTPYRIRWR